MSKMIITHSGGPDTYTKLAFMLHSNYFNKVWYEYLLDYLKVFLQLLTAAIKLLTVQKIQLFLQSIVVQLRMSK